jgi:hypothetical protein
MRETATQHGFITIVIIAVIVIGAPLTARGEVTCPDGVTTVFDSINCPPVVCSDGITRVGEGCPEGQTVTDVELLRPDRILEDRLEGGDLQRYTIKDTRGADPSERGISLGGAGNVISDITGWVVGLFWVIVVLFAVLAAFNYLTAQGSEEKITKAKQMVVYTLIAAAVALLGTGIRAIVSNVLKAQ